jgi:hypothetical protein
VTRVTHAGMETAHIVVNVMARENSRKSRRVTRGKRTGEAFWRGRHLGDAFPEKRNTGGAR